MSFWQFIDELIRNPPLWIILIVVALLVRHLVTSTSKIAGDLSAKGNLFEVLELLIVITLLILTVKSSYWDTVKGGDALHEWYEHPLAMLALLLMTTLASMIAYIKIKRKQEMAARKLGDE